VPAEPPERLVDGDPREPRRERGLPGELGEPGVGEEIGLLHRVLDLRLVAEQAADGAVDARVVAADEQLEELGLAAPNAPDELRVGGCGGRPGRDPREDRPVLHGGLPSR
jgi:hypothetical protein